MSSPFIEISKVESALKLQVNGLTNKIGELLSRQKQLESKLERQETRIRVMDAAIVAIAGNINQNNLILFENFAKLIGSICLHQTPPIHPAVFKDILDQMQGAATLGHKRILCDIEQAKARLEHT